MASNDPLILSNVIAFSTDGVGFHSTATDNPIADYNCVFGNFDGEYSGDAVAGANDVNADPEFDDDDLHLLSSSPCIDAGDPDLAPEAGETDIDNEDRIAFARVDIGCDETQD
ncbi:MAG: hypothetical protein IIC01_08120 [Planctomycetes bacterium]|nr:hypothetical protein [Planctomycetota bacterium]